MKVSASDFVGTRKGKITEIYKMEDTLGGGNTGDYYFISNSLYIGAYGQVKKAKHRKSGVHRAIKLIKKSSLSTEDLRNLTNEVEILKNLVRYMDGSWYLD